MNSKEVEKALFRKATGFKEELRKPYKLKTVDYDPETGKKVSEREELMDGVSEVFVTPDTSAMIFWLKNRCPSRWSDKSTAIVPEGGEIELPSPEEDA